MRRGEREGGGGREERAKELEGGTVDPELTLELFLRTSNTDVFVGGSKER